MSVEMLQTLSLVAYILSGVFFAAAVALFFLLKIPRVIGEISGSTAKKAIERIRQQNETSGEKAYKPSAVNISRGKITDRMSKSGKLYAKSESVGARAHTEKIGTQRFDLSSVNIVAVLADDGNSTAVLSDRADATTLLVTAAGATTVLDELPQTGDTAKLTDKSRFSVDVEISFTDSDEIIE